MAQRDDSKYSNRLEDAQKARAAMLEKAKASAEEARKKLEAGAPERAAIAAARDERQKQKAEEKRLAAERAIADAARRSAKSSSLSRWGAGLSPSFSRRACVPEKLAPLLASRPAEGEGEVAPECVGRAHVR